MVKELINRVPIKEEWVYIADHYVDLGKVFHVQIDKDFVRFQFLGKEEIIFQPPILADETGHPAKYAYPDSVVLSKKEFDVLLDFIKQRFGIKELAEQK